MSMILFSFGVATLILIIPGAVVSDDLVSDADAVSDAAEDAAAVSEAVEDAAEVTAAGAVNVPGAGGRESCLTGGSPHLLLSG